MWMAIGLAMLVASVWIIMRAKPDANGNQHALVARSSVGSAIALAATTLFAFGLALTIYGALQLLNG